MTDLRQAAEIALKAQKNKTTVYVRWDGGVVEATEVLEEALTQALAEPPSTRSQELFGKTERLEAESKRLQEAKEFNNA